MPSFTRSRTAVTMCETGLMFTNHCSHSGMVSTGTNAFERNVSGKRISIEMPCTLEALRAITPKNAKIHDSDQAHTITSTEAAIDAAESAAGTAAP